MQRAADVPAHAVHVVHEHNRVVDHDPDQDDQAEEGVHVQGRAGDRQGQEHAEQRERHGGHDDEGLHHGFELDRHHRVDEEDREQDADQKLNEDLALLLELAAHLDREAVRRFDARQGRFDFVRHVAEPPAVDAGEDLHVALLVLAVDRQGAFAGIDAGDRPQGHDVATRGDDG